jgi:pimeloyl-ACP methyl ester carboxylesterase
VLGEDAPDLIYLPGWISNVELNWDQPAMARFLRGLARGRRLIVTDPRGMGCSERSSPRDVWPLETMMEDINVLLDATGSERAAILATDELGFVACMFAATYPERAAAVILFRAAANFLWSEETPWEWTEERFDQHEEWFRSSGTRAAACEDLRERDPSLADDPASVEWWYRWTLLHGATTRRRSCVRSTPSSPRWATRRRSSSGFSPPSSSPTSSARPRRRPSSEIAAGATWSSAITRP